MAKNDVATISTTTAGAGVRTCAADLSRARHQSVFDAAMAPAQESGLRENCTSRLSERAEAGRTLDLSRLYSEEGPVMGPERRGCVVQPWPSANRQWEEPVDKAKPFKIPKREVWEAFKRVKANQGAAGVDGQSIAEFEANLAGNLYKLCCRQEATFLRRYGGSTFQRRMAERGRWAYRRWPIASPRRSSDATWSRYLSRRSTPTPMATGPANRRSRPCTRLASAAGATTGCSISTSRASSIASTGSFCSRPSVVIRAVRGCCSTSSAG